MFNITKIKAVFYSPAGSTRSAVSLIAQTLSEDLKIPYQLISYTYPDERERTYTFAADELVIWGTCVNAGRIPNKTLDFVKESFHADSSPAIAVVTYGGRSYDNAPAELAAILGDNGCCPVGACAIVSRHVFSRSLAAGRPDDTDRAGIVSFSHSIAQLIRGAALPADPEAGPSAAPEATGATGATLRIPGEARPAKYYTPLKTDGTPAVFLKARPKVDTSLCISCRACVRTCPMGSISMDEYPVFDGICVKCQACVLACPKAAISIDNPDFLSHIQMLETNFQERKESEFFIV